MVKNVPAVRETEWGMGDLKGGLSISEGSSMCNGQRLSDGDLFHCNGWGLAIDNGVESMDVIGCVSDSSDATVWFNKGVLALDSVAVSSLGGSLGIPRDSVRHTISVVVLGVGIIRLGISNHGLCYHWGVGVTNCDLWSQNSSLGNANEGEKCNSLDHFGFCL